MIKKIRKNPLLFLIPALVIVIMFTIIPLFTTINEAFTKVNKYDYSNRYFSGENFSNVASDPLFKIGLENTSILVFIGSPIALIFSFGFAYLLTSFSNKKIQDRVVAIIFSQFFVSIYAIGSTFMLLFGVEKNVLNSLFKTNINWNSSTNRFFPILLLLIFLWWKLSTICTVLFVFGLNKVNTTELMISKIDNLKTIEKLRYVYFPKMKNVFMIVIWIVLMEALFLYPTIFENTYGSNGQTVMYYIVNFFNSAAPSKWGIPAAGAIIFFAYMILIFVFLFILMNLNKWIGRFRIEK
ncbi:MAG: sugar ABC transporter permease [Mycoplasma sp.]|nr:sugar ABC transporter permease [Mycoplasma sp.]